MNKDIVIGVLTICLFTSILWGNSGVCSEKDKRINEKDKMIGYFMKTETLPKPNLTPITFK